MLPNAQPVYGLADVRISNPLKPFLYVQAVGPVSASIRSTEHILRPPGAPALSAPRGALAGGAAADAVDPRPAAGRSTIPPGGSSSATRCSPGSSSPSPPRAAGATPWPAWLAANPDFAARALVAPSALRPALWTAARPRDSTLEILALKPARLIARARLAEERLLASSVYQDGGWRLLLDGHPHAVQTADGPFLAAWLPAGEHRVELIYRAPGFLAGLGLAAVGFGGDGGVAAGAYRHRATSSRLFRLRSGTSASAAG